MLANLEAASIRRSLTETLHMLLWPCLAMSDSAEGIIANVLIRPLVFGGPVEGGLSCQRRLYWIGALGQGSPVQKDNRDRMRIWESSLGASACWDVGWALVACRWSSHVWARSGVILCFRTEHLMETTKHDLAQPAFCEEGFACASARTCRKRCFNRHTSQVSCLKP